MLPPAILCIDDRPESLKLRRRSLEQQGYAVETTVNAASAIQVLNKRSIAAVLLDYRLEGIDAQAVAYQIKQRYPRLPIVLVSAYSEMPESLLWLVDEYVMRSEPAEGVSKAIERVVAASKVAPRSSSHSSHLAEAV